MSASTVHVKNISAQTGEKEVKDFFSFCGKIASIEITPTGDTQSATVNFEKDTAAKTALLLDNTQLGATHVQVTSASGSTEDDGSHYTSNAERDSDEITQEQKPRSRIIAEYLAHGYVVGDQGIQKAIDLDQKHGVSSKFLSTLQSFDQKLHATDKAKSVDQSYGVTQKTNSLLSGLTSYYEKAAGTPTGQKIVNFYTQTSKQVQDIHAEARRLADIKKEEAGGASGAEKTTCKCGSDPDSCPCEKGQCACADCPKSNVKEAGQEESTCKCSGKEGNVATPVAGGKTTCDCGGEKSDCPCVSGQCACKGCAK